MLLRRSCQVVAALLMVGVGCDEPTPIAPDWGTNLAKGGPPLGSSITVAFRDAPGDSIQSDGRGTYADGVCGVSATFNGNDARLATDASRIRPKDAAACIGRDPRTVAVTFGGSTVGATFFVIEDVELVAGTMLTYGVVHGAGCPGGLVFDPTRDAASDWLEVSKNADGTWTITTQGYPEDVAACIPDEHHGNPPPRTYHHLPVELVVQRVQ